MLFSLPFRTAASTCFKGMLIQPAVLKNMDKIRFVRSTFCSHQVSERCHFLLRKLILYVAETTGLLSKPANYRG